MSAVVANSLSSLTTLSSNPPKYPRNPAQEVRDPLVLYIARVPGSKDIFLTTLKPRQKTVTGEDVTSSLYYMHVNQPEDDLLQDAEGSIDEYLREVRDRSGKEPNQVERKPLPTSPQLSSLGRPEPPLRDYPDYQHPRPNSNRQTQLGRKPIVGSAEETPLSELGQTMSNSLQKRPFGPRPIGYEPQSMSRPPGLENWPSSERVEQRPVLPPRPGLGVPPNDISLLRGRSESPTERYKIPAIRVSGSSGMTNSTPSRSRQRIDIPAHLDRQSSEIVAPESFSITLIRRDPSSGGQWNVGQITITSVPSGSLSSEQQSKPSSNVKSGAFPRRILVEITNPGYGKFLAPKRRLLYATPAPEGRVSLGDGEESIFWKDFAYQNGLPIQVPEESNLDVDDGVFRREVWAEGTGFWDRNLKKRGSGLVNVNGATSFPVNEADSSSPRISGSERPSFDDSGSTARRSSETRESFAKPMAKGDVFTSPWDGRCEFSTGVGGRSLKCKHILPIANSPVRQVSELRFNLPASSAFSSRHFPSATGSSSSSVNKSSVFAHNIRKHLLSSHHRSHNRSESPPATSTHTKSNNYNGDDDDVKPGLDRRLSIELGQEKAGGGSGGKRTKLGKLIIEDEGQKMLDLIVAVNMGLWWRAWERIDYGGHMVS